MVGGTLRKLSAPELFHVGKLLSVFFMFSVLSIERVR